MALLESATHGGINLHGSILPKYRGAAPIQRAILDGETKTGITLMQMAKGMDTGDIIAVEETEIGPDETYGELQSRLALIAASMAKTWCARLASGLYPRMPQDDSQASIAPKVMKDEAELQMSNDAAQEYNRYRAFTPAPGAFISTRFGRVGIARAAMASGSGEPGTLLGPDIVAFSSGALQLVQVKPEGKTTMSGRDFTNGMRLRPGQSLIHE
jgi:methionyl-tRNA formyltransferase